MRIWLLNGRPSRLPAAAWALLLTLSEVGITAALSVAALVLELSVLLVSLLLVLAVTAVLIAGAWPLDESTAPRRPCSPGIPAAISTTSTPLTGCPTAEGWPVCGEPNRRPVTSWLPFGSANSPMLFRRMAP